MSFSDIYIKEVLHLGVRELPENLFSLLVDREMVANQPKILSFLFLMLRPGEMKQSWSRLPHISLPSAPQSIAAPRNIEMTPTVLILISCLVGDK